MAAAEAAVAGGCGSEPWFGPVAEPAADSVADHASGPEGGLWPLLAAGLWPLSVSRAALATSVVLALSPVSPAATGMVLATGPVVAPDAHTVHMLPLAPVVVLGPSAVLESAGRCPLLVDSSAVVGVLSVAHSVASVPSAVLSPPAALQHVLAAAPAAAPPVFVSVPDPFLVDARSVAFSVALAHSASSSPSPSPWPSPSPPVIALLAILLVALLFVVVVDRQLVADAAPAHCFCWLRGRVQEGLETPTPESATEKALVP